MNDEATTHYNSIIDQHSLGAEFLRNQFGECGRPKIGWQIDPFGHSNANARLFAEMGFDAYFFWRIDFQDKAQRLADKSMEWIQRPMFKHLGKSTQIFAHAFYNDYCSPHNFAYDVFDGEDDPFVTDRKLTTFNADERTF